MRADARPPTPRRQYERLALIAPAFAVPLDRIRAKAGKNKPDWNGKDEPPDMTDRDTAAEGGQREETNPDRQDGGDESRGDQPTEGGDDTQNPDGEPRGADRADGHSDDGRPDAGQATAADDDEEGRDADTEDEPATAETRPDAQPEPADADRLDDVAAELATLREQLEQSQARIDDLESELADYERRNDREHEELRKYAVEDFAAEMLKVKDSLVDAIELESLDEGTETRLRMVGKQFDNVLTGGRIDKIVPDERDQYDDALHRMAGKEPTADHEPGQIVRVQEIGYRIHDRVIRPARVVVAEPESE